MGDSWVPLSKGLRYLLPCTGIYDKLQAAYCLQLDFDEGKAVTIKGYSKQWGWSRNKVRKFLRDLDAEIVYPEKTTIKQNQKGFLKRIDQKTEKGQIKGTLQVRDLF